MHAKVGATDRPVVFLFPGLSGDIGELDALRNGCRSALRFVPIHYPHWVRIRRDGIDLSQFVAHCLAQVEVHTASEPTLLAGYSFGGHVAFAVAAALEQSGHQAVRLGLLDTSAIPSIQRGRRSMIDHLKSVTAAVRAGEASFGAGNVIARMLIRSRYTWPLEVVSKLNHLNSSRRIISRTYLAIQMNLNLPVLWKILTWMTGLMMPFHFQTVLFRCRDGQSSPDRDLGWGRYVTKLRIVPISGNHTNLLGPPNIPSLCNAFAAAMTDGRPEADAKSA